MVLRRALLTFLTLSVIWSARGADPYSVIDLNEDLPNFSRYYGSESAGFRGGSKGGAVCGGFDCDGDGYNDTAFAQIQASPMGRTKAGEITFIFGDGNISEKVDTAGFSQDILKIAGDQNHEIAGAEIWMDDVNGDGLGYLLIGRQNYTKGDRIGAGALTIIFGHPILRAWAEAETYLDLGALPVDQGNEIVTIVGAAAGDRLGIWMRAADVNGDGVSDVVVGADQISSASEEHLGGVYVIQGGPHLQSVGGEVDLMNFGEAIFLLALQSKVVLVTPPSGTSHYHFGATLNVADLDGNGRAEVLASAALNRAGAVLGLNGSFSNGLGGSVDGSLFIAWDENFPPGPWPLAQWLQLSSHGTFVGRFHEDRW